MMGMTPKERAAYADQLLSNPLFGALLDSVEHDATEAMIYATDDTERARAATRVQAIRDMRRDCINSLTIPAPKTVA